MFGIEFMSFVYLVVYIGAIAILFLFMIMMLNLNSINSLPSKTFISLLYVYICLFLKGIYFIFLTNKNIFLFYLDNLECVILSINLHKLSGFGSKLIITLTDNIPDLLISGLDSSSDLFYFCSLCVTSYMVRYFVKFKYITMVAY